MESKGADEALASRATDGNRVKTFDSDEEQERGSERIVDAGTTQFNIVTNKDLTKERIKCSGHLLRYAMLGYYAQIMIWLIQLLSLFELTFDP